jgi:hypothetical protein
MRKVFFAFMATLALTPAAQASDFCGRINSLPDAWTVLSGGSTVVFRGDNSMPPDSKDVYGYLNTHHSDSDKSCFCITGAAEKWPHRKELFLTQVTGLKTCAGKIIR